MAIDELWPEAEWLTFSTARDLREVWEVGYVWDLLTERRCQLFAAACCRRIWEFIPDEGSKRVVDALERVADGEYTRAEFEAIDYDRPRGRSEAQECALSAVVTCRMDSHNRLADVASIYCLAAVMAAASPELAEERERAEARAHCDLVRDILGNPFRPAACAAESRTSTVTALATQMYGSRDFAAMPILADALEEAGCDDAGILAHCRGPGPHVRGCWALDLVLGKG